MNILLFTQTFPLNPDHPNAHFLYDFTKGFVRLGHKVTVLLPFHPDLKPQLFKEIEVIPFRYMWLDPLHLIGYGRTLENNRYIKWFIYPLAALYVLFSAIALFKLVKVQKPAIINAHWIIPNGFVAALVSKVTSTPLVISLAGTDVYVSQMNFITKLMAKFAISCAKEIISNSPLLLMDLKTTGKIVSYPVPPNTGKRTNDSSVRIAAAGRLVSHKGFDILKEVEPTAEIISGLSIDQFREKLLGVDIFVAPSIRDPSGNLDDANTVVLQAMAAGCAVIATNFPGYRRMITHGKNGMLFPAGNKDTLAQAIQNLKSSKTLRQTIGKVAQQTVLAKFTPQKIAKKYLTIFKQAIENTHGITTLANVFYSTAHSIMYNVKSRRRVATQAYEVIAHFLSKQDLHRLSCLDIGCSTGIITSYFAPHFKRTIGVDIDKNAISFAKKTYKREDLTFRVEDARKLTFPANSFDVIICQEVYENVDEPTKLLSEIYRVLKPGGICYFTADNLLFPIESQYKIPFLLYLPDTVAALILRLLGHKRFYLGHFKTYWGLKTLCKQFIFHDYTLPILRNPQKYKFTRLYKYKNIVNRLPNSILSMLYFFIPTFIWILQKQDVTFKEKRRAVKMPSDYT